MINRKSTWDGGAITKGKWRRNERVRNTSDGVKQIRRHQQKKEDTHRQELRQLKEDDLIKDQGPALHGYDQWMFSNWGWCYCSECWYVPSPRRRYSSPLGDDWEPMWKWEDSFTIEDALSTAFDQTVADATTPLPWDFDIFDLQSPPPLEPSLSLEGRTKPIKQRRLRFRPATWSTQSSHDNTAMHSPYLTKTENPKERGRQRTRGRKLDRLVKHNY